MSSIFPIEYNIVQDKRCSATSIDSPFKYYFPGCSGINFHDNSKTCSICLNQLNIKKSRPNKCNHLFCLSCLSK